MSTIRNFTSDTVRILDGSGELVAEFPSEGVASAAEQSDRAAGILFFEGKIIPTVITRFGGLIGLPTPKDDVYIIVSPSMAKAARASGRATHDLLYPSGDNQTLVWVG